MRMSFIQWEIKTRLTKSPSLSSQMNKNEYIPILFLSVLCATSRRSDFPHDNDAFGRGIKSNTK